MVEIMKPAIGRVGEAKYPQSGEKRTVYIVEDNDAGCFTVKARNGDTWLVNSSEIENIRRPIL